MSEDACPYAEQHTPSPAGYTAWHAWADRMRTTHRQAVCPGCDRYKIWIPMSDDDRPLWVRRLDPDPGRLQFLRQHYQRQVQEHLGVGAADRAISVPGAMCILRHLAGRIVTRFESKGGLPISLGAYAARDPAAVKILDMGLGYLTLCVQDWADWGRAERSVHYVGRDHDPEWVAFVRDLRRRPRSQSVLHPVSLDLGVIDRGATPATSSGWWSDDRFDVIIVDHGPQLQTRADDVPWLVEHLRPDGVMLFDDWRPKHEGRIRRAFAKLGGDWEISEVDNTKRFPRDKGIGRVTRR